MVSDIKECVREELEKLNKGHVLVQFHDAQMCMPFKDIRLTKLRLCKNHIHHNFIKNKKYIFIYHIQKERSISHILGLLKMPQNKIIQQDCIFFIILSMTNYRNHRRKTWLAAFREISPPNHVFFIHKTQTRDIA